MHKKFAEMLRDSAPLTPEFAAFARPIAEVVGLRFHSKPLTIRVRTEATKCVDHRFSQPERTPGASQLQVTAAATVVTGESRMFPAHEARVRAAATQGPEALRRYIHRTRMIWNFYYPDFALGQ